MQMGPVNRVLTVPWYLKSSKTVQERPLTSLDPILRPPKIPTILTFHPNNRGSTGEMKKLDDILDVLMLSRKIKLEALINIESVLFKLFTNKGPTPSGDGGSVDRAPGSVEKTGSNSAVNSYIPDNFL